MAPHQLSQRDARRIAVSAQLLQRDRPTDVVETVRQLSFVQLEPTNAIAPSADLVLWSRIGPGYDRRDLVDAIDELRLIDFRGTLRPAEDMALFTAEMAQWPGQEPLSEWRVSHRDWVRANNACRTDILERLRADGPLISKDLPDTCVKPWRSAGWNDDRNVVMMLDLLVQRGEVAVAGRQGRDRLWDLAERIYPDDPPVPLEEAVSVRNERRLRSLGIARPKGHEFPVEPLFVGTAGEEAVVEGTKGVWRVDPSRLGQPFHGRAALLSPFDRLLHDRKRMTELFDFEYVLEMFKPVATRRWGYYALPVLYGDRLVGKLDAAADRGAGVLRVNALHWDVDPSAAMRAAVDREIDSLAEWLGLGLAR